MLRCVCGRRSVAGLRVLGGGGVGVGVQEEDERRHVVVQLAALARPPADGEQLAHGDAPIGGRPADRTWVGV